MYRLALFVMAMALVGIALTGCGKKPPPPESVPQAGSMEIRDPEGNPVKGGSTTAQEFETRAKGG